MAEPQTARERLTAALERGVSRSFTGFYQYVLDHPVDSALNTATQMGEALGVDPATVVRACQHLGYSGWPGLRREMRAIFRDQPAVRDMDNLGKMATNLVALRKELPDPHSECGCLNCRLARLLDSMAEEIHAQFGQDPTT